MSERRRPLRPQPAVRNRHVEKATRYQLTHFLNLPRFFGSCIIARVVNIGADKCTMQMFKMVRNCAELKDQLAPELV